MVEPFFTEDHVESLRPYIKETVQGLLNDMVANGCDESVDLVEKFALPVPSYVRESLSHCPNRAQLIISQRSSTPSWEFRLRI